MVRSVFFLGIFLMLALPVGGRNSASDSLPNRAFDEYGAICWYEEKARLDNFAVALLNTDRTTLGHIIVYDGQRACRGEAVARAIRAKKYLVDYRKVPADRIVWRWGGYVSELMTQLVIHPAGAEIWPFLTTTLSLDEVTFIGNCNRRVRPVKCPKILTRPTNRWTGARAARRLSRDFRANQVCARPVNSTVVPLTPCLTNT